MPPPPPARHAIGLSLLAAVVLAAAFMPWGQALGTITSPFGESTPFGSLGSAVTVTFNGWNGNVTLCITLPNWLVVLAAAGIALVSWLRAIGVWNGPGLLRAALAVYGLAHAALMTFVLVASDEGTLGVGVLLTAFAFVAMLFTLWNEGRTPASAYAV